MYMSGVRERKIVTISPVGVCGTKGQGIGGKSRNCQYYSYAGTSTHYKMAALQRPVALAAYHWIGRARKTRQSPTPSSVQHLRRSF